MSAPGSPLYVQDAAGEWRATDADLIEPGTAVRVAGMPGPVEATFDGPGDLPGVYRLTLRSYAIDAAGFEYIAGPIA